MPAINIFIALPLPSNKDRFYDFLYNCGNKLLSIMWKPSFQAVLEQTSIIL